MNKNASRRIYHNLITTIILLAVITLFLLITACGERLDGTGNAGPTAPSTPEPIVHQKLRISNQSTFSIQNLVVRFPEDQVNFGDVLPGETTDYRVVPLGVYRYAAYDFEIEGQKYQQPVIDWVGESLMNGKAFTYILDVDPSKWETEGQVIELVQVIEDQ